MLKQISIYITVLIFIALSTQLYSQGRYNPDNKFGTYDSIPGFPNQDVSIPLQTIINNAVPGEVIVLEPGFYTGPAYITTSGITIDGNLLATISGLGIESVINITADNVTIKNLIITNSGGSHDRLDAGIKIKGDYNTVENCRISECLFGVDIFQCKFNLITHNEISSITRRQRALKGDAIRLWYSTDNLIKGNYWHNSRDMVVWYSSGNRFEENLGVGNRYSIHFMYAHSNRIQNNEFYENSVGVFLMYSEETLMIGNTIMRSTGISGMCLGLKETSSNQILNNRFIYSSEGIHVDVSPYVPEKINTIANNEIAFCGVGIFFHTNQEGNLFKQNYFHNNLIQIEAEGKTASLNKWDNNYYDDYEGFDRDDDNVGDTPYSLYSYVEHLWTFNQNIKFFYGSPLLLVLDFLERLAPFSQPKFVLRDKKPMYIWEEKNIKKEIL